MKLKELFDEAISRESYKKFKEDNPTAYLSAGFFVFSSEGDQIQLDFLIPEKNKMASTEYPFNSFRMYEEDIKPVEEIKDFNLKIDVNQIIEFVKEKTKKDFSKIIAILINNEWNLTCINGMNIYRIKVNAYTKEVSMENNGILTDMIKVTKGNRSNKEKEEKKDKKEDE